MEIIAIVPMKLHSERVPGKNLRILNGKPLYYWIIRELIECKYSVFVDTDSDEIVKAVGECFKQVDFIIRPVALRGDAVSMNDILQYDLEQINGEHFIQTHSTSPLLTSKTLKLAVTAYSDNLGKFDSLYSVSPIQARCYTVFGEPINHNPNELIQTQLLQPIYVENSGFYIFSRSSFAKTNRRIGERPYLYPISQYEAIDIDDEDDFRVAEVLCAANKR